MTDLNNEREKFVTDLISNVDKMMTMSSGDVIRQLDAFRTRCVRAGIKDIDHKSIGQLKRELAEIEGNK